MPTNPFINSYGDRQDQALHADLMEELIEIHGHDILYLPRTLVKRDDLFGDDILSKFNRAFSVPAYLVEVDGFGGSGDFLDKLGLNINDQYTFQIGRRAFERYVLNSFNRKPNEGDYILHPNSKTLFEVKFVEDERPFYVHGVVPVWEIKCEMVSYSQERVDTGNAEVDTIAKDNTYTIKLVLQADGTGTFRMDEEVIQIVDSESIVGFVNEYDKPNRLLYLRDVTGEFTANVEVMGQESDASWNVESVYTLASDNLPGVDNQIIADAADDGIENWDEANPFGTY